MSKRRHTDVDGNADGIYFAKDDWSMRSIQEEGQPICVIDSAGNEYYYRVGVAEFTPIYSAELDNFSK